MHNPASALMATGRPVAPLAPSLTTAQTTSSHGSSSHRIRNYSDLTHQHHQPIEQGAARQHAPLVASTAVIASASSPSMTNEPRGSTAAFRRHTVLSGSAAGAGHLSNVAGSSSMGGPQQRELKVHPCFTRQNPLPGDVLVKVQGVHFYCHKAILYFASPFFRAVLDGDWKESHPSLHERSPSRASWSESEQGNDDAPGADGTTVAHTRDTNAAERQDHAEQPTPSRHPAAAQAKGKNRAFDPPSLSQAAQEHDPPSSDVPETTERALKRESYHTAFIELEEAEGPHEPGSSQRVSPRLRDEVLPPESDASQQPSSAAEIARCQTESTTRRRRTADEGLEAGFDDMRANLPDSTLRSGTNATGLAPMARSPIGGTQTQVAHSFSEPGTPMRKAPDDDDPVRAGSRAIDAADHLDVLATPPQSPSQPSRMSLSADRVGRGLDERHRSRKRERREELTAVIDLPEEEATIFQDVLFHLYPQLDLLVNWTNVAGLFRFDEQYEVHGLRSRCTAFLYASLAGRPIEAMALSERHARRNVDMPGQGLAEIYKEASRHVLDNITSWQPGELSILSLETNLKLERKRTWFLERLLKLSLANPERDYECHAACPDPTACARLLGERFRSAFASCFRYGQPQPSNFWRVRQLESAVSSSSVSASASAASSSVLSGVGGVGGGGAGGGGGGGSGSGGVPQPSSLSVACDASARTWMQTLFDRMFNLPPLVSATSAASARAQSKFLHIKLYEPAMVGVAANVHGQHVPGGAAGAGQGGVGKPSFHHAQGQQYASMLATAHSLMPQSRDSPSVLGQAGGQNGPLLHHQQQQHQQQQQQQQSPPTSQLLPSSHTLASFLRPNAAPHASTTASAQTLGAQAQPPLVAPAGPSSSSAAATVQPVAASTLAPSPPSSNPLPPQPPPPPSSSSSSHGWTSPASGRAASPQMLSGAASTSLAASSSSSSAVATTVAAAVAPTTTTTTTTTTMAQHVNAAH